MHHETNQELTAKIVKLEGKILDLEASNREHQYGGAIFHANCPYCDGVLSMPKGMSVNNFMDDIRRIVPSIMAFCKKCGPVKIGLKRMEIIDETS